MQLLQSSRPTALFKSKCFSWDNSLFSFKLKMSQTVLLFNDFCYSKTIKSSEIVPIYSQFTNYQQLANAKILICEHA